MTQEEQLWEAVARECTNQMSAEDHAAGKCVHYQTPGGPVRCAPMTGPFSEAYQSAKAHADEQAQGKSGPTPASPSSTPPTGSRESPTTRSSGTSRSGSGAEGSS